MITPSPLSRPVVLVITDSLGFPRSEPEYVDYAETYIAQLRASFPNYDIVHYGHGGATIERLFDYTTYYHKTVRPILCIMQCGVVDCAPRALTEMELQILKRLPFIGRPLGRLVQRNAGMLRQFRSLSYTSLPRFEAAVARFEATFPKVQWITIPPPTTAYEDVVPGMTKQVSRYNAVLAARTHISTADFNEGEMMSDHHHLNARGHFKIFRRIQKAIAEMDIGAS